MHGKRPCKSKKLCGINGCERRHHPLLHSGAIKQEAVVAKPVTDVTTTAITHHHHAHQTTLFRVISVTIYGNKRTLTVYAFLDGGSSMTLVDKELAEQLGLDGEKVPLCLQWTANVTRSEKNSKRISFEISGTEN